MQKRKIHMSINVGFITNSSSVIYHFPAEALNHPKIKSIIDAFEIKEGFVGKDLWDRSECASIAVTKEQKKKVQEELNSLDWHSGPSVNVDSDEIIIIYGDEYDSLAMFLASALTEIYPNNYSTMDYN